MTDTSRLPEEIKTFIREHYREFGPKECARLTDVPYGTLKRWANKHGLKRVRILGKSLVIREKAKPHREAVRNLPTMHVAEKELEALNRRAWR